MKNISSILVVLTLFLNSCITEKINTTPLANSYSNVFTSEKTADAITLQNVIETNQNAYEITEVLASFPLFKNELLNKEINSLKIETQNYLYAVEANNIIGKQRNLKNIEAAYKKIQKIREQLNEDENEIINSYMVRLKTNISQLESVLNSNNQ